MAQLPPPPPSAPPPPPAATPPPPAAYAQAMTPPPQPSPGYIPPAITPSAGGINLGAQILGAGWSIGVGVAGILLPILSAMILGGTVYYFYVLPVFGLVSGIRSITRGYVIGGVAGIALNVLAGIASLAAAGAFSSGG
jgi:hypothetical protein